MNRFTAILFHATISFAVIGLAPAVLAGDALIHVQADQVLHPVSPYLTGACIEDVNHEVYGGIYSQMIFGESFLEPSPSPVPKGFKAWGGRWLVSGNELHFTGQQGDKLISEFPPFKDGEVGVDVLIADASWSNVGLLVRASNPGMGVDRFEGYEIALNAAKQTVLLGRHRQNWEPITEVPCPIPVGQWVAIKVRLQGSRLEVFIDNKKVITHVEGPELLGSGSVGLRAFQTEARYRNLWIGGNGSTHSITFEAAQEATAQVSGLWRSVQSASASGTWSLETNQPFKDSQSQKITFIDGKGSLGVENQGLNRWGLHFVGGKPYEGAVWVRAESPGALWVSLESADGAAIHAEKKLSYRAGDWQRLTFTLTPKSTEIKGRFAITLRQPGAVALGHAFLQPGEWGRFKGLPVRKDVAEGLIQQGITVLRYGGCMVNDAAYRWKNMIGQRDRRPAYRGFWYPHSSNGWGILDFLDFCEAAGFESIPDFYIGETPQDMADFIEYAKGPANSEWGRRRVADGHPKPYRLRYIELGNEERVNDDYAGKFEALAKAIWAKDPGMVLVVGDFSYSRPIQDPEHVEGAAGGITNLHAQKRILQLAKQYNREVWFDVHVGTEGPRPDSSLEGMYSFRDALAKLADGARFHVVVFELNAGNHGQRRALANAVAIQSAERDGGLPVMTSANCLQSDGQNDNDWDQGLLFLNPAQVWLQPPGYITQMISQHYQPLLVQSTVSGGSNDLDVIAKRSDDSRTLVVQVVNLSEHETTATLHIDGFTPSKPVVSLSELTAPLYSHNTALWPERVRSRQTQWEPHLDKGRATYAFPPHSFTVMVWR